MHNALILIHNNTF